MTVRRKGMDFKTMVKCNKKIMTLIRSKYPDDFPLAYNNSDAQYYNHLVDDVFKAEAYLERAEVK